MCPGLPAVFDDQPQIPHRAPAPVGAQLHLQLVDAGGDQPAVPAARDTPAVDARLSGRESDRDGPPTPVDTGRQDRPAPCPAVQV